MRARRSRLLACGASLPVLAIALGARGQARSVWEGVYTEAQAKRGEALYFERCVRCHGATFMGGTDGAGALLGPTFNGNWNGVPLDQMLDRVRLQHQQDPGREGRAAAPGRDAGPDSVQGVQVTPRNCTEDTENVPCGS